MTRFLRTGKKTRPKTSVKGKRYHCAMCRKRSPKPVKTPAPWYCPKCVSGKESATAPEVSSPICAGGYDEIDG
jgi:ribosomal protein L37AE/L43A